MLVMTQRGKTFPRQKSMIWVELSFEFLVCLNSVLKAKLGGHESPWNENVNVDLFRTNLLRLHSCCYKAPKQKTISKMSKIQNRDETSVIKFLECSKLIPQVREYYNPIRGINLLHSKTQHVSRFSQSTYCIQKKYFPGLGVKLSKILALGRYFGSWSHCPGEADSYVQAILHHVLLRNTALAIPSWTWVHTSKSFALCFIAII